MQSQTSRLAEKDRTIERKEQIIAQKDEVIAQKDEIITEQRQQARQLETQHKGELGQKVDEINRLERQLGCVNQQLEESEQINAKFQKRIAELKRLRPAIKLMWREGKEAPCQMNIPYCAASDGSNLYY